MGQIFLRKTFSQAYYFSGPIRKIFKSQTRSITAVDFHYFVNDKIKLEDLEVSFSTLDYQLSELKNHCEIIPVDQIMAVQRGTYKFNGRPTVQITIDDADISMLGALPYFEKYKIPLTLFVPVGLCLGPSYDDGLRSWIFRYHIESGKTCDISIFERVLSLTRSELESAYQELKNAPRSPDPISQRPLLNWPQIESLCKHPLVTIASHSMSHPALSSLPQAWANWEIATSLKYLKTINAKTNVFAYPYGSRNSFNAETKRLLNENGIDIAYCTLSKGIKQGVDPLEFGRVGLHNIKSKTYLRGLVRGAFEVWDSILGRS